MGLTHQRNYGVLETITSLSLRKVLHSFLDLYACFMQVKKITFFSLRNVRYCLRIAQMTILAQPCPSHQQDQVGSLPWHFLPCGRGADLPEIFCDLMAKLRRGWDGLNKHIFDRSLNKLLQIIKFIVVVQQRACAFQDGCFAMARSGGTK